MMFLGLDLDFVECGDEHIRLLAYPEWVAKGDLETDRARLHLDRLGTAHAGTIGVLGRRIAPEQSGALGVCDPLALQISKRRDGHVGGERAVQCRRLLAVIHAYDGCSGRRGAQAWEDRNSWPNANATC